MAADVMLMNILNLCLTQKSEPYTWQLRPAGLDRWYGGKNNNNSKT